MFPEHHTCKIPKNVDTWVVHGLWPSIKAKTDGPFFCNKSLPFDPKKLDWKAFSADTLAATCDKSTVCNFS